MTNFSSPTKIPKGGWIESEIKSANAELFRLKFTFAVSTDYVQNAHLSYKIEFIVLIFIVIVIKKLICSACVFWYSDGSIS